MAKTWRELEAEGIRRCCAMYYDGKRCRRRAAKNSKAWESFCTRHGPIIQRHTDFALKAMRCDTINDDEGE